MVFNRLRFDVVSGQRNPCLMSIDIFSYALPSALLINTLDMKVATTRVTKTASLAVVEISVPFSS